MSWVSFGGVWLVGLLLADWLVGYAAGALISVVWGVIKQGSLCRGTTAAMKLLLCVLPTTLPPKLTCTHLHSSPKNQQPTGLLCLKTAKSGGKSELASSITIYNELLKRDPKIIQTLVRCTHSC